MKTINYKYNKIAVVLPLCLGQLIREDNGKRNQTYLYEYDDAGNITALKVSSLTAAGATPIPTATESYTYSTGPWGDLLTSFKR